MSLQCIWRWKVQGQEGGLGRPGWKWIGIIVGIRLSKCGCSGPPCLEKEDCRGCVLPQACLEFHWDNSQDE